jgi:quinoprotein dehydrogenase-associated probable ABC transporter substrate-binding protein
MPACSKRLLGAALSLTLALTVVGARADTSDLVSNSAFRVCADPANMPFSNQIAELLAGKLGLPVAYTWFPQATGFVRRTLTEHRCDVIMGFAQGHELVLNTNHYYVSAYSLVTRADGPLASVDHIGDPLLRDHPLGVVAGTPPADHVARAGLLGSVRSYPLVVDSRHDNTADRMIADLESGAIDAAFMWGPIAGWKAKGAETPLVVTPLLREEGPPRLFYRVTLGVRFGEDTWKRKLNSLLRRNKAEIDAILAEYGMPLVDDFGQAGTAAP